MLLHVRDRGVFYKKCKTYEIGVFYKKANARRHIEGIPNIQFVQKMLPNLYILIE